MLVREGGHLRDRVEVPGVDLARVRDHDRGRAAEALQLVLERTNVQATGLVRDAVRDPLAPDPEHRERFQRRDVDEPARQHGNGR